MYIRLHAKYQSTCSCQILIKFEFSRQIFEKKNPEISNFMKIHPLGAEWFQAERRTDRHTGVLTDMTRKIAIFPNFANEHESCQFGSRKEMKHILKQIWKKTAI